MWHRVKLEGCALPDLFCFSVCGGGKRSRLFYNT